MGLEVATVQNVILTSETNLVEQIGKIENLDELATKHGIFVSEVSLDDHQETGLSISAEQPRFVSLYAGEVFEFSVPTSIENGELEKRAVDFLSDVSEVVEVDGNYDLTRAGMRTIVFS